MIYKCPECGWQYDPVERAAKLGLVGGLPVEPEELMDQVPFHRAHPSDPLICDGSAETPVCEESNDNG